jgi:hypothetical protein
MGMLEMYIPQRAEMACMPSMFHATRWQLVREPVVLRKMRYKQLATRKLLLELREPESSAAKAHVELPPLSNKQRYERLGLHRLYVVPPQQRLAV